MGGTPNDMQARLSAQEDTGDVPPQKGKRPRVDPADSILRGSGGARTNDEALEMMYSEGICEDCGTFIRYTLQRPLEPLPKKADGSDAPDPYAAVRSVTFTKRPYASKLMVCLQVGEANLNQVNLSHIVAFSSISETMAMRLDATDFRLMAAIAHASYEGNHKSSTASSVH